MTPATFGFAALMLAATSFAIPASAQSFRPEAPNQGMMGHRRGSMMGGA